MGAWARLVNRFDLVIETFLRWDADTMLAISGHPALKRVSGVLVAATYLGDGYLWGGLALGLILFGRPIDRTYVLIGLGITIVSITLFRLFKILFNRPRPLLIVFGLRSRLIDSHSFHPDTPPLHLDLPGCSPCVIPICWSSLQPIWEQSQLLCPASI